MDGPSVAASSWLTLVIKVVSPAANSTFPGPLPACPTLPVTLPSPTELHSASLGVSQSAEARVNSANRPQLTYICLGQGRTLYEDGIPRFHGPQTPNHHDTAFSGCRSPFCCLGFRSYSATQTAKHGASMNTSSQLKAFGSPLPVSLLVHHG